MNPIKRERLIEGIFLISHIIALVVLVVVVMGHLDKSNEQMGRVERALDNFVVAFDATNVAPIGRSVGGGVYAGMYSGKTKNIVIKTADYSTYQICQFFLHEIGHMDDDRAGTINDRTPEDREVYADAYRDRHAEFCGYWKEKE
jgi:hypothetical protein